MKRRIITGVLLLVGLALLMDCSPETEAVEETVMVTQEVTSIMDDG
jgi:hypothetical protein